MTVSEPSSYYGPLTSISSAFSPAATLSERVARDRLSRKTPADTDVALQCLRGTEIGSRGAEWYYLMGVCALRRGYLADALAHLDRACTLGTAETVSGYRALYELVQGAFEKRRSSDEDSEGRKDRDYACCSAVDCCDCLYCCDCDGNGSCCDGSDGCCDCDCCDC